MEREEEDYRTGEFLVRAFSFLFPSNFSFQFFLPSFPLLEIDER